jgi:hypothetical protein
MLRLQVSLVLRSVLTRYGDLTAERSAGAVYIGLGDQFDDDRRLVRETASKGHPATRPPWPAPSSGYFRRSPRPGRWSLGYF